MLARIIEWSVRRRLVVLVATAALALAGAWAMLRTPVDAIPDLSDVQVIVMTEWPGQAPALVEDQVTYPLSTELLKVPRTKVVRGMSQFGLSAVYVVFEDGTDLYWARSRVLEYLNTARERVQEISARFGFHVDPDALVEDLPVGVQQRVEIIKALSRDAKVLVFDEPTAVLTPQETDELMGIMRQLKESGTSIVFITHKLREVREVAARITVIRLGKVVGEAEPTATNAELTPNSPKPSSRRSTPSSRTRPAAGS